MVELLHPPSGKAKWLFTWLDKNVSFSLIGIGHTAYEAHQTIPQAKPFGECIKITKLEDEND